MLKLILFASLLCVTLAKPSYVLTGPKVLLKDSTEKFCISVEEINAPAHGTLDLVADDSDTIYASTKFDFQGSKSCWEIYIPQLTQYTGRLRLHVRFEGITDYSIDNTKGIALRDIDIIDLIQTDKAWYTPGQLVRFRVLSLNHLLQPLTDPIESISIEDPSAITVSMWTNLTTVRGIQQLELQLSQEPVQGIWRIFMKRNSRRASKEFEVREYVLPKYEVILHAPTYVTYDQSKIPINICAKYTYGQPVKGKWKIVARVSFPPWYWRSPEELKDVEHTKHGHLNNNTGCYTVKLSAEEMNITSESYGRKISVTAVVIEHGTSIEMNNTASVQVTSRGLKLDISSWSPKTFRVGLPYYGKIKVTAIDDTPAPNRTIQICVSLFYLRDDEIMSLPAFKTRSRIARSKEKIPEICSVRLSDMNGIVSFELLPSDPSVSEYKIWASVPKSSSNPRTAPSGSRRYRDGYESEASTYFSIQNTYSPSDNFLTIVPPPGFPQPVECNSQIPIKFYFTADKEINFNLHYSIVSRGDLISTGIEQVKFREEDNVDIDLNGNLLNRQMNENSTEELDIDSGLKLVGDVEIKLKVVPESAPKFSILAYYIRDSQEVITANLDVPVQNCFPNPVKFSWSNHRRQPGQSVTMKLNSGPGSICAHSVVDRSVTFARPDLQLSESTIYGRLSKFHIDPYNRPRQVTSDWEYCGKKNKALLTDELADEKRLRKRSYMRWNFAGSSYKDAMEAFDNTGLLVMSDLTIETRPCAKHPEFTGIANIMFRSGTIRGGNDELPLASQNLFKKHKKITAISENMPVGLPGLPGPPPVASYDNAVDVSSSVAIRSYFPETWLWDLLTLDSKGEAKQVVEVPHTLTTWVGRALCVSESNGFGMSNSVNLEVFQPFFVELHLPYSAKRGEKLLLKTSVFNYLNSELPVRLTLKDSDQLELLSESNWVQLCIPPKSSVVHNFKVHPIEIGKHNVTVSVIIDENYPGPCGAETLPSGKDTVVKSLLVQPEGFPVERIYSHLACPTDFEEDKILNWDLSLPADVVENSARAWVTAVGDLMGPALQGLSSLVRLPAGCGEQNMILFTPNIYVVQYLEATNQLDPSVKSQAIGNMRSGYQRELTYRHTDGSYSAFGNRDPSGSLWLTAFVVKSFAAARKYIQIDEQDLSTSVRWLISKQLENGCFPVVGTVLHKDLKGGLSTDDENLVPLTAYTLIALLESSSGNLSALPAKVLEAFGCIEPDASERPDLYAAALTAYAYVLAGKTDQARNQIQWLFKQAKNINSLVWWEKEGSGQALNVEMTSYVLLTLVKLGEPSDVMMARSIVRWLSKQRNSEGGFVSTQDTIVALQAIAQYAAAVGSQSINMEMLVASGDIEHLISIREEDRLVQKKVDLLPLPSVVSISSVGEGKGCAAVQAILRYNVHTAPENEAFDLTLSKVTASQSNCGLQRIGVCARYLLGKSSNMALIEIAMVSGYQVVKSSLDDLTRSGHSLVKRYELKDDVVVLYFDEISSNETCLEIFVEQTFQVSEVKDAIVKVYDYYHPEHTKSIPYSLPTDCSIQIIDPLPLPKLNGTSLAGEEFVE